MVEFTRGRYFNLVNDLKLRIFCFNLKINAITKLWISYVLKVSLVSLALELLATDEGNLSFLRVLRSLRAFRPLRAMSRFHGIKVSLAIS